MSPSRSRSIIALIGAVLAFSALATPAAAETVLRSCTGVCGHWKAYDESDAGGGTSNGGAACDYDNPNYLHYISVKPPAMNGRYAAKTKVDWRFKIRHASSYSTPTTTIYTSSYQSAKASLGVPATAGAGFSRRRWNESAVP